MQRKILRLPICRFCGSVGKKKKDGWSCTNTACISSRETIDIWNFEGVQRPFGARTGKK